MTVNPAYSTSGTSIGGTPSLGTRSRGPVSSSLLKQAGLIDPDRFVSSNGVPASNATIYAHDRAVNGRFGIGDLGGIEFDMNESSSGLHDAARIFALKTENQRAWESDPTPEGLDPEIAARIKEIQVSQRNFYILVLGINIKIIQL